MVLGVMLAMVRSFIGGMCTREGSMVRDREVRKRGLLVGHALLK